MVNQMYKEGEYVVYGLSGVCLIEAVTTIDIKDMPKDVEYYVLSPLSQGGKIYTRVDSSRDKIRPVISKDEAENLIKKIDEIEPLEVSNEKMIEELYKNAMRSFDCREWVRLIKCIYERKLSRVESGKKVTATDEKYMRMAEDALYSEIAIALGTSKDKVLEIILSYH